MSVDWSRPIEAVHDDGRVVPATYDRPMDKKRGHKVTYDDGDGSWSWCVNNNAVSMVDNQWRIRNVARPTPVASATEPGVELVGQLRGRARYLRDRGEQKSPGLMEQAADKIDWLRNIPDAPDAPTPQANTKPDLTARMEALVRRMALADKQEFLAMGTGCREAYAEADAIVALLPAPVDPDLLEARQCVASVYENAGRSDLATETMNGKQDNRLRVQSALAAIKRGRALERGEP